MKEQYNRLSSDLPQQILFKFGTTQMQEWVRETDHSTLTRIHTKLSQAGRLFGHEAFLCKGVLFPHSPAYSSSGFVRMWLIYQATVGVQDTQLNSVIDFFNAVFYKGDMHEQIAALQSLDLLNAHFPACLLFLETALDALRTNNALVFSALALNNSFPEKFFSEEQLGHMVLKALYMNLDASQIFGIERILSPRIRDRIEAYKTELMLFDPEKPKKKGLIALEELMSQ